MDAQKQEAVWQALVSALRAGAVLALLSPHGWCFGRQPSNLGPFYNNLHLSPTWAPTHLLLRPGLSHRAGPNSARRGCCLASWEGRRVSYHSHPQLSPWAEKDWTEEDRGREKVLMQEMVTLIEQRNAIVNCLDEDRQR